MIKISQHPPVFLLVQGLLDSDLDAHLRWIFAPGGFFPKALLLPTLDVARSDLPELNLGEIYCSQGQYSIFCSEMKASNMGR